MFCHQGGEHVPLAAVRKGVPQQKCHCPVVCGPIRSLDYRFKNKIHPFQLVPEHQVVLTEFKILNIEHIFSVYPAEVQAGKHPASAGPGLISH